MKRTIPLGVTILGTYIALFGIATIVIALNYLQIWEGVIPGIPSSTSDDINPLTMGIIYILVGISRLWVGVGVLNLKKASWKGAIVIISIGVFMDLFYGHFLYVIIGVIALLYLIFMKKYFRFHELS